METYYVKQGRRYVAVSHYDDKLSRSLKKGSHLIIVHGRDGEITSTLHNIQPDHAALLSAAKFLREDMVVAAQKSMQIQPEKPEKFTKKQRLAWEAFVATLPKNGAAHHAHFNSLTAVLDAAVRLLEERAKEWPVRDRDAIYQEMSEHNPDALLWDGFDQAYLGPARRCGQPTVAAYSYLKCIGILINQGMEHEEAIDHFEFNTVGGWLGEHTPICIEDING